MVLGTYISFIKTVCSKKYGLWENFRGVSDILERIRTAPKNLSCQEKMEALRGIKGIFNPQSYRYFGDGKVRGEYSQKRSVETLL